MQKKIINHHKLKRKWGRLFDRNAILPTDPALEKSRKDFAWKSTKQNPYYKEETSVKQKVLVYIGIMSVLLTIGVGIYHPFFYVKTVKVDGLERVSEEEFKNAVFGIIQYKKWYVFPGQNYFLINVHDIKDILLQRFPLSKIVVQKKFPHELSITIQEKISTIIYDNGKEYSYIGVDGNIVEIIRGVSEHEWNHTKQIVTSTDAMGQPKQEEKIISSTHVPPAKAISSEMGDYPIIYDTRGKDVGINTAVLKKETAQGAIQWFQTLKTRTDIPFGYISLESEVGDAVLYTREGWRMNIRIAERIEEQFQALQTILKDIPNRAAIQYIDLRYPGRVYWQ